MAGRPTKPRQHAPAAAGLRRWMLRAAAGGALLVTLWTAGPRAGAVLAARYSELGATNDRGPQVELDRVGFRTAPSWLRGDLLRRVAADLAPHLDGRLGLLDQPGATVLRQRLAGVPWVGGVRLRRLFPDRLGVSLELRRPELAVCASPDGAPTALVDARGFELPAVAVAGLPRVQSAVPGGGGGRHRDPCVVAAAAVAAEWRCELVPRLSPGSVPALLAVDASNLGYVRLHEGRTAEVRVALAAADSGVVWLDYGHPPGSPAPRIDVAVKADVLREILAAHPGLAGIHGGDLRFKRRWRDWIRTATGGAGPPALPAAR